MKLYQTLSSQIYKLPLERKKYFPEHLADVFKKYILTLKRVDDQYATIIREQMGAVERTCDDILEITQTIFEGKSIKAYDLLSSLLKKLEGYLIHPNSKNVVDMNNTHYFKARISTGERFNRSDMFHIPFQKRYSVGTNRFSVPGLPCLYLSDSIYTCWEELDRPLFYQMYVSRFKEHRINLKYLNLTPNYDFIHEVLSPRMSKKSENESFVSTALSILPSTLNLYPLMAACYTKVKDRDTIFKPEYIFPQLIMQWVLTQDYLHGVKYLSTKAKSPSKQTFFDTPINYALPVREIRENGYCDFLSKHLQLTTPLSLELLSIYNPTFKEDTNKAHPLDVSKRMTYKLMEEEKERWYLGSAFGFLETELQKMKFDAIR